MLVENHGIDLRRICNIPVIATHVDIFCRDIGKEYCVFLEMKEVVAVYLRLSRGETHNPLFGFADGVAHKTQVACRHQIGNRQFVVIESILFDDQITDANHPDGLVVAPEHIVAYDHRIHGCLDAVGRIARTAFGQFRGNQVILNIVGGILVGHAARGLKTDGSGSALETVAYNTVAVTLEAVTHVGEFDINLSLVEDIVRKHIVLAIARSRFQLNARHTLEEETTIDQKIAAIN